MGYSFEFEFSNIVAYLTASDRAEPPRLNRNKLESFLHSVAYEGGLVSHTSITGEYWSDVVRNQSEVALHELLKTRDNVDSSFEQQDYLSSTYTAQILEPLRSLFNSFDLYVMLVGDLHRDKRNYGFFEELAMGLRDTGLVLQPRFGNLRRVSQIVDPFPALSAISDSGTELPLVVFWTRNGNACSLKLEEAITFYFRELRELVGDLPQKIDECLLRYAAKNRRKRILHLSDLHLGAKDDSGRRILLKNKIVDVAGDIDRVVVTGDLIDTPNSNYRTQYEDFKSDIKNSTGHDVIVVPGNHDVRLSGNQILRLTSNSEYITDIDFRPIIVDDSLGIIFFCFNSCDGGSAARGRISSRQMTTVTIRMQQSMREIPERKEYLRVALLHHHPIKYPKSNPAGLWKSVKAFFVDNEFFLKLENSDDFLNWCVGNEVKLVLHGHKHIPRHIELSTKRWGGGRMTLVGCGSSTGVGQSPMCYDIIKSSGSGDSFAIDFYADETGYGAGFKKQAVQIQFT